MRMLQVTHVLESGIVTLADVASAIISLEAEGTMGITFQWCATCNAKEKYLSKDLLDTTQSGTCTFFVFPCSC